MSQNGRPESIVKRSGAPEARAALEQIAHGLDHSTLHHESDRRQALISFDNAVELIALAWLRRQPALKREIDQSMPFSRRAREYVARCIRTFASKSRRLDLRTIEHAHEIRNGLYHDGKVLYPDRATIENAKDASIELYRLVFGSDVKEDLEDYGDRDAIQPVHEQIAFLADVQSLTEVLWALADVHPSDTLADANEECLIREWRALAALQPEGFADHSADFADLLTLRKRLVLHGLSALQDVETRLIRRKARELRDFIERYTTRVNILARAAAAFEESPFREDLEALQIVLRANSVFICARFRDGSIKEDDLDYFQGRPECVNEDVRIRTVKTDMDGNVLEDTVNLESIKTVKMGRLFNTKAGMMGILRELWSLDDLSFAMCVDVGQRSDLFDGLPKGAGSRAWPATATSFEASHISVELLDPIEYNPHPFVHVKIGTQ